MVLRWLFGCSDLLTWCFSSVLFTDPGAPYVFTLNSPGTDLDLDFFFSMHVNMVNLAATLCLVAGP